MISYKNKDIFYILLSTMFLLVISSNVTAFWIERELSFEHDFTDGNRYITISGLILLIGLILYTIVNKIDLLPLLNKNKILVIIVSYCFISCFWSPEIFIAIRRFMKFFIIVYLIVLFGYNKVYLMDILRCYILFTLIASIIIILIFPEYGFLSYMGEKNLPRGVFTNKNFLGAFCTSSILLIINYNLFKKYYYLLLATLFILLLATNSVTAIIGLFCSLFILCAHYILSKINNQLKSVLIFSAVLMLISVLFIMLYHSFNVDTVFKLFNKDTTFTGRDELWKFFIDYSLKNNFLFGTGFNSFFNGYKTSWILSKLSWAAESAHSDYIQTLLDLGAIGVSFLVLFIISSIIKGFKDIRLLSVIVFFTIESFFEINFLRTTFIFITVLYSLVRYNNYGGINE